MIHPMKKYSGPLEISTGVELSIKFENIRFCGKYYAQTNVRLRNSCVFPQAGILDLRFAEQWSTRRSKAETFYYSNIKSITGK